MVVDLRIASRLEQVGDRLVLVAAQARQAAPRTTPERIGRLEQEVCYEEREAAGRRLMARRRGRLAAGSRGKVRQSRAGRNGCASPACAPSNTMVSKVQSGRGVLIVVFCGDPTLSC
jgi:hypothetical protein